MRVREASFGTRIARKGKKGFIVSDGACIRSVRVLWDQPAKTQMGHYICDWIALGCLEICDDGETLEQRWGSHVLEFCWFRY